MISPLQKIFDAVHPAIRRGYLMRRFNVTGLCNPKKDYMVDITNKLIQVKEMIDYGEYFAINRAKQFGKTTILSRLRHFLADDYTVAAISFECWGDSSFVTEKSFCQAFLGNIKRALKNTKESTTYQDSWFDKDVISFEKMSLHIDKMCQDKRWMSTGFQKNFTFIQVVIHLWYRAFARLFTKMKIWNGIFLVFVAL